MRTKRPDAAERKAESQRRCNAQNVFLSWELIMFEKLKRTGSIPQHTMDAIFVDMASSMVPRWYATQFLEEQIKDMKEQIAEQAVTV